MSEGRTQRSWLAGLIGHGVGPSLTPEMHEREAVRQGLRYVYKVIDLPDGGVDRRRMERLLAGAVELGFDGLNITHPMKHAVVPFVDELAPAVKTIGALNTVLIRDGRTSGHNTDLTGFRQALVDGLPDADRRQVVLLGAGGAGTAVAHALADLDVGMLIVIDPSHERAHALARSLRHRPIETRVVESARDGLVDAIASSTGLVNATPIGMAAHPGSPVPAELLRQDLWVADIVYRPLETDLLTAARQAGCAVLSGARMAVYQAADAFDLITGRAADRTAMLHDFDDLVAAEATTRTAPQDSARATTGERKE